MAKPKKVTPPPKQAPKTTGAAKAKPNLKDRLLDKAAAKLFPPSTQGKQADDELRRIAEGEK